MTSHASAHIPKHEAASFRTHTRLQVFAGLWAGTGAQAIWMGLYNAGLVFSLRPGGRGEGAKGGEGGAVGQLSKSPLQCTACQAAHRHDRGLGKRSTNNVANAPGSPAKELGVQGRARRHQDLPRAP